VAWWLGGLVAWWLGGLVACTRLTLLVWHAWPIGNHDILLWLACPLPRPPPPFPTRSACHLPLARSDGKGVVQCAGGDPVLTWDVTLLCDPRSSADVYVGVTALRPEAAVALTHSATGALLFKCSSGELLSSGSVVHTCATPARRGSMVRCVLDMTQQTLWVWVDGVAAKSQWVGLSGTVYPVVLLGNKGLKVQVTRVDAAASCALTFASSCLAAIR
jgi:hypothetical protein